MADPMIEEVLTDVRDVLTGCYGLAEQDDSANKRLARIAQLVGVPVSEWNWPMSDA